MEGKSRKPENTPFKQQKLKAWQPILTPAWVIGTFAFVGLVFIPIGVILNYESENVVEASLQYDGAGADTTGVSNNGAATCALETEEDGNQFDVTKKGCILTFNIDRDMVAPIYVYYQLDNFYQNHRRYVQSRSDTQLRGEKTTSLSDCDPLQKQKVKKYNSLSDQHGQTGVFDLNPCGLIANSLFNDIFWINRIKDAPTETGGPGAVYYQDDMYKGGNKRTVDLLEQTGIAWQSDIDHKFKNYPADQRKATDVFLWQNGKYRFIIPSPDLPDPIANKTAWTVKPKKFGVQDEHFIVWMRTAGLPNFRKLYGKINVDLKRGQEVSFLISANFVVNTFEGKKYLVLSTTSWFGGRNPFLGIAYITVGAICFVLALLFFIKHKLSPRKLGDTRYLVWKNRQ